MTRYLLDTNIVSEATRKVPSPRVMEWMGEQSDKSLFTSAVTIGEVWRGILQLPESSRRRQLEGWFFGPEGPPDAFAERILPFDEPASLIWGRLMADGNNAGRPRSAIDMMIAAIAEANDCVVVTYNEKHFSPMIEIINLSRL